MHVGSDFIGDNKTINGNVLVGQYEGYINPCWNILNTFYDLLRQLSVMTKIRTGLAPAIRPVLQGGKNEKKMLLP